MSRKIKQEVNSVLKGRDLLRLLRFIDEVPARKAIQPLLQAFYRPGSTERWHAITAFGRAVDRIAAEDMEDARVIIRRLMWSLNDESGGIGWGAPEAMAEAMANNRTLAEEYSRILLSYIWEQEEGNFLEFLPLRRGALWGLMRLAETHPDIFSEIDAGRLLKGYLKDSDPESRALAALAAGLSSSREFCGELAGMLSDRRIVSIYLDGRLEDIAVADAAAKAFDFMKCRKRSTP